MRCGFSVGAARHLDPAKKHFPIPGEDKDEETRTAHYFLGQDEKVDADTRAELHRQLDVILNTVCVDDPDFILDKSCTADAPVAERRFLALKALSDAYRTILGRLWKLHD